MNKQHNWVRHTIEEVKVRKVPFLGTYAYRKRWFHFGSKQVVGCDNCGLGITKALLEEPCLSDLEDQLEEVDQGS